MNKISPYEKQSLLIQIEKLWEFTNAQCSETPCSACVFWRGDTCTRWGFPPPIDVRPTGCDEWKFNSESMPF